MVEERPGDSPGDGHSSRITDPLPADGPWGIAPLRVLTSSAVHDSQLSCFTHLCRPLTKLNTQWDRTNLLYALYVPYWQGPLRLFHQDHTETEANHRWVSTAARRNRLQHVGRRWWPERVAAGRTVTERRKGHRLLQGSHSCDTSGEQSLLAEAAVTALTAYLFVHFGDGK